ncbi:MAG: hypothetical protein KAH38_02465, partial [Candidatus Hydrogenedentes bacterium]|nr:hypothetical protein [Candidatus Hydrogenedentota bacterium]
MKKLITVAVMAVTLTLAVTACANCGCSDKKAETKTCKSSCACAKTKSSEFFIKDNDSVVFLGDSITQQKLYTTYIEAYTLTRFPEYNLTFRNSGWGG